MSQRKQRTSSKNFKPGTVQQFQQTNKPQRKHQFMRNQWQMANSPWHQCCQIFCHPLQTSTKLYKACSIWMTHLWKKIKDLLKYAEILHGISSWSDQNVFRVNHYLCDDVTVLKALGLIATIMTTFIIWSAHERHQATLKSPYRTKIYWNILEDIMWYLK